MSSFDFKKNTKKNIALKNLKEFKYKILGFHRIAKITSKDIGGECKFIADPFIQYDTENKMWLLFVEIASPARRQIIGVLKSKDLKRWEYQGEVIKGSRESFPFIFKDEKFYYMIPCVEATPAPGLVPIYRAKALLGSWELAYQFVLPKSVNDRVMLPCKKNHYYFIYGTRTRFRPTLEYIEIKINDYKSCIEHGASRVLIRSNMYNYLRNRILKYPRATMRPAGSLNPVGDGYVLPIQGTYTGRYGECIALTYISEVGNNLKVKAIDFLDSKKFNSSWSACHHISFFSNKTHEVFAVDGHPGSGNWEVEIYSNI